MIEKYIFFACRENQPILLLQVCVKNAIDAISKKINEVRTSSKMKKMLFRVQ